MCLGVPMQVKFVGSNQMAEAEAMGVKRTISVQLVPGVQVGDHVLVHAGYAIEIIDPLEAASRIKLLQSMLEGPVS